jgi:hypothetical protein
LRATALPGSHSPGGGIGRRARLGIGWPASLKSPPACEFESRPGHLQQPTLLDGRHFVQQVPTAPCKER